MQQVYNKIGVEIDNIEWGGSLVSLQFMSLWPLITFGLSDLEVFSLLLENKSYTKVWKYFSYPHKS
mgnify:FL=1